MKVYSVIGLQVIWIWTRILFGEASLEKSNCLFKLRGSGRFSYPDDKAVARTEYNDDGWCRVSYSVPWTRDVLLQVIYNETEEVILYEARRNETSQERRLTHLNVYDSLIPGDEFKYFLITFPSSIDYLTVVYTSIKVRVFECELINDILTTRCTKGTRRGSRCNFVLPERAISISATCGQTPNGSPTWIIKKEGKRLQEVPVPQSPETIVCDLNRCNVFPDNIKVISCTNGKNLGSNCTLQCKEGFVPAPHLYGEEGFMFPKLRENVPEFWTVCSYDRKYDILATWKPHVSTNGFKNFRNPQQLYLDCMKLEDVTDFYTAEEPHYLDFNTAREFYSSPYDIFQMLFFLKEDDQKHNRESGKLSEQTLHHNDEIPSIFLVPEDILLALNDEEWRWVLRQRISCLHNERALKLALFQRPPPMEPGVFDFLKADRIATELKRLLFDTCDNLVALKPPPACSQYCVWDISKGAFKQCGSFEGAAHMKNCLICKLKGSCSRSDYLE